MKKQNCQLLAILVLMLFASCKKEKDNSNNDITNVNGFWGGAYSFGSAPPSIKMSVVFRSNGTARVIYGYNGTDTASATYKQEGTYTLQNSVLNFRYKEGNATFVHKASLTAGNVQSGTWGAAPSETDGGLYSLVKQ